MKDWNENETPADRGLIPGEPGESELPAAPEKRKNGLVRALERIRLDRGGGFDINYFLGSLTQVVIVLCCVAAVAFFAVHLVRGLTDPVRTVTVRKTTETVSAEVQGYVLRRETPVTTRMRGMRVYCVPDGAKVQVGKDLCFVYPTDRTETAEELARLDAEIALLQSAVSDGTVFEGLRAAQEGVRENYAAIMSELASGSAAAAIARAAAFRAGLDRVAALSGEGDAMKKRLNELKAERAALEEALGTPTGSVTSEEGGYFFSLCDGYEEAFSALLDGPLNPKTLAAAAASEPAEISRMVGKIAPEETWYVAMAVDAGTFGGLKVGTSYDLVFPENGGLTLPMKLEKCVMPEEDGDTECLLLFSSNRHPKDFLYLRSQTVRITVASYTGFRVPLSAVHSADGQTGVYTLNGGTVLFRKIDVLWESDGYYIAADTGSGTRGGQYYVLGFDPTRFPDGATGLRTFGYTRGLRRRHNDPYGQAVKYGRTAEIYYGLEEFENLILGGDDLYHGKVLN